MRSFTNFKNGTSIIQVRGWTRVSWLHQAGTGFKVRNLRQTQILERKIRGFKWEEASSSSPLLSLCRAKQILAPVTGGFNPVDPVLPWIPQDSEPAHIPQPGSPVRAHQPASPHGGGEEAQTQLLMPRRPPKAAICSGSSDRNDEDRHALQMEEL